MFHLLKMHTRERVTALVVGVLVLLAAGTVYCYGVYLPQLMAHLGLTASDLATIGLATNLGLGCGGLPGGFIIDHFGPQKAIILAAGGIFGGYLLVYYFYSHVIATVLGICVAMAAVGFGSITSYFSCLKAAQANFPRHRGAAGALPVSAYGLSATVFSAIATLWFDNDTGGLLKFFACFCGAISLVGLAFVHVYLDQEDEDTLGQSSATATTSHPNEAGTYWALDSAPVLETSTLADQEQQAPKKHSHNPIEVIKRRLTNKLYLTHFLTVSLAAGIGQMYIYSVGYIVQAQAWYDDDATDVHKIQALQVLIISISSFLGRVIAGFASDQLHKRHYLRLWMSVLMCCTLALGQLVTYTNVADEYWLSVGLALTGVSYGLAFGTYPAVIADQFGTRTFSITWGLTCVGPFITLVILNKYFGWIYDAHAVDGICRLGNACYQPVFGVSFALCFVMLAVVGYVIWWRRPKTNLN